MIGENLDQFGRFPASIQAKSGHTMAESKALKNVAKVAGIDSRLIQSQSFYESTCYVHFLASFFEKAMREIALSPEKWESLHASLLKYILDYHDNKVVVIVLGSLPASPLQEVLKPLEENGSCIHAPDPNDDDAFLASDCFQQAEQILHDLGRGSLHASSSSQEVGHGHSTGEQESFPGKNSGKILNPEYFNIE